MDFHRAATFDDLLAANMRFLRGRLPSTPYCAAPLALESGPLLAGLERLHTQHRVLTFESQPGACQAAWVPAWSAAGGRRGGGHHVETQQRAYVDAWVEAERLPALLARLAAQAGSLCYLVDFPGQPELFRHTAPPGATWACGAGAAHLNLTRQRAAPSAPALAAAPWQLYTNAQLRPGWADQELRLFTADNPALAPVLQRCALVGVMALEYGPTPASCASPLEALLGEPPRQGGA